ncbi:MAG: DNA recombination protein RmuC [Muribaculaceae bacterium]|nr:DNA recombination protein RmuC [Muribaculaceae bacterium]
MIITIVFASIVAIIAIAVALTMHRSAEKSRERYDAVRSSMAGIEAENARLRERLSMLEAEHERREADGEKRFKYLASEIMRQQSRIFKEEHETRLGEILTPLKEEVGKLGKSIQETYSAEARERFALDSRIKELVETNLSIGREAKELSSALRGNSKIQGDWGEMILETILQKSGLVEGTHYTVQQTTDNTGRTLRNENDATLRPDVVVNYPDGRVIVIDSKVSLTAFVDLVSAEDDSSRNDAAARHLASVKKHVLELSRKSYQDYVGSSKTDFVMMFIPNEPAYIEAMRLDNNLWQEAYDHRVLIVSPTHLISALRLVDQLWRQDSQNRNAIEIATRAGRMYDKFVGFIDDMEKIDKSIKATQSAYTDAMRKLSEGTGNLVSRARQLQELGAKTSKMLPQESE